MNGRDEYVEEWDEFGDHPDLHDDDTTPPYWFPGGHLPQDARAMGLTHHVPEGALLDLAGRLDSTKPLHKAMAWLMLFVFGMPVVFAVMRVVAFVWPSW